MIRIVLLILINLLFSAGITDGQPVRIAYLQSDIHQLPCWVALEKGFFEKEGVKVEVAGIFKAGPELMSAFAAGALDMGYVGVAPATTAVANKTAKVVVLAQVNTEGSAIVVKKDGKVQSIPELVDKSAAVPGHATVQDSLLRRALLKFKTQPDQVKIKVLKPYLGALDEVLRPYLITRGGPIVLYGVENEYDWFELFHEVDKLFWYDGGPERNLLETPDTAGYMTALRDLVRADGIDLPITTCPGSAKVAGTGDVPGVIPMPNVYVAGQTEKIAYDIVTSMHDPARFGATMIDIARRTRGENESVEDRLYTLYQEAGQHLRERHPEQGDALFQGLARSVPAMEPGHRDKFITAKL